MSWSRDNYQKVHEIQMILMIVDFERTQLLNVIGIDGQIDNINHERHPD